MSEENMEKQEEKCNCGCETKCPMMSEDFRKFLIVTVGTFLGVFFALNLFAALNKPSMPCPMKQGMYGFEHRMDKGMMREHFNPEFDADFEHDNFEKPMHK